MIQANQVEYYPMYSATRQVLCIYKIEIRFIYLYIYLFVILFIYLSFTVSSWEEIHDA
jgi:hypothetical protein